MLRHVVMFQWVPGTTDDQVEHAASGLRDLVDTIPEIRSYTFGADLQLAEPRWDFVVVADFDDADGWRAYDSHAAHNLVRSERMAHIIAARAAVQFEL